jgi:hypothetical protein
VSYIRSIENNSAAGGFDETQQGSAGGRFTAARFTDNPQNLSPAEFKGNPIHGLDNRSF